MEFLQFDTTVYFSICTNKAIQYFSFTVFLQSRVTLGFVLLVLPLCCKMCWKQALVKIKHVIVDIIFFVLLVIVTIMIKALCNILLLPSVIIDIDQVH